MRKIDFENVEVKLDSLLGTREYSVLVNKIKNAKRIYLCGNGGLHFVANHAATDMTRLVPGKAVYSFESIGFLTSNLNDYGGDNMFTRYLDTISWNVDDPASTLVIGLSCSGNSANVINALTWAYERSYACHMISGVRSKKLPSWINELVLDVEYFHTAEIMTLMIFYDLIMQCGHSCPTIEAENIRKGY